jgi:hypothetical protein
MLNLLAYSLCFVIFIVVIFFVSLNQKSCFLLFEMYNLQTMDKFELPDLAPPGAGIPWLENIILEYFYYPIKLKQTTWSENLDRLQRETRNIINICEGLSEQEFQTRVLIKRLRGMEDSSRYWSAALVIDHLLISLKGMSYIANELALGHEISVSTGTALVKPKQENVTNKLGMLSMLKESTLNTVAQLQVFDQNHSDRYKVKHPWFGLITAEGWVWTLAQHQALHRRQIQLIAKQL